MASDQTPDPSSLQGAETFEAWWREHPEFADHNPDTRYLNSQIARAAWIAALAALPEPPGKSAESGERETTEIERREIWRKVQLMAGDGLNSTGEGSPAWNAVADIHSFAVGQQLGVRTEPMNLAAAPKPPEKPRG